MTRRETGRGRKRASELVLDKQEIKKGKVTRRETGRGRKRASERVLTNDHEGEVKTSADRLSVHLVWKGGESDELVFILHTHTHDTTHFITVWFSQAMPINFTTISV